jgi:hypothetical protein
MDGGQDLVNVGPVGSAKRFDQRTDKRMVATRGVVPIPSHRVARTEPAIPACSWLRNTHTPIHAKFFLPGMKSREVVSL